MQHRSEQPFFHFDDETIDHLTTVMPRITGELEELHFLVEKLSHKGQRRMERIRRHMMTCGQCLSNQIKNGFLIPIEDYLDSEGSNRASRLEWLIN